MSTKIIASTIAAFVVLVLVGACAGAPAPLSTSSSESMVPSKDASPLAAASSTVDDEPLRRRAADPELPPAEPRRPR